MILSNPKMLVLFGALIPPFLRNGGNAGQETQVMGVTFAIIAAVSDSLYALAVGRAGAWMTRSRTRAVEFTRGACLTVGAAWTALRGRWGRSLRREYFRKSNWGLGLVRSAKDW